MRFVNRPWGRARWMLERIPAKNWSLLGSLSSEARGLAIWELLHQRGELGATHLLRLRPPDGHPRGDEMTALADGELNRFLGAGGGEGSIKPHYLLERHGDIVRAAEEFLQDAGPSIVLDITSMPKRFFFPLLRFIVADASKPDIIVTYTVPERYARGPLHEDVEAPGYLPAFMPRLSDDDGRQQPVLVVAVGFESPGLVQVLEEDHGAGVHYLFPFPSAPPFYQGTWEFLQEGMSITDDRRSHIEGITSRDPGSVFDKLLAITNGGRRDCVLAPYGPKPVSLAMCLFAIGPGADSACVRYAQPKYYNPEYSAGIAVDRYGVVSYAYPIRIGGRNYYAK